MEANPGACPWIPGRRVASVTVPVTVPVVVTVTGTVSP